MLRVCLFITIFFVTINYVNTNLCGPVEVRNKAEGLKDKLKDCTVVVSVQLLLVEKASFEEFENISFPQVREILEYFVLYRVKGLKSIAKLFPNLTAIRGRDLYMGYAFIVSALPDLQEVSFFFKLILMHV